MYVHVVAVFNLSTSYVCLLCLVPVSAGYPSPADDYLDGSLDLNQHLIKHPTATFFVRVAGESMREAGIHSGDVLIVDRALTPGDGSVIIAIVNGMDKKNKRPFDATPAAPLQRTWCWQSGAGLGRGVSQGCLGGQQVGQVEGHTGGDTRSRVRHPVTARTGPTRPHARASA